MKSLKILILCFCMVSLGIGKLNAQTPHKIDWKTDLEIYKTSLEQKHIHLYHSVTKKRFTKAWKQLYDNVDRLTDFEVIIGLMRLTRLVNDGHTAVSLQNLPMHRFPFTLQYIEGKWIVAHTLKAHENLLKTSLVSINGIPIEQVASKISKIAQFVENNYSLRESTGRYLTLSELLFNLDIIPTPETSTFVFRKANNEMITTSLKALDAKQWSETNSKSSLVTAVPEIKQPIEKDHDLWFAPILSTNAVYINFKGYPKFNQMQQFGEQLITFINENNVKQVIIDMRKNGGGDLYIGILLAYALNLADSIDWEHGVFVLTSNYTFSAATSNAALFKQLLNAKIVGQPTGSNPNGFQDMDSFALPYSKLVITYSKRVFRLSEKEHRPLRPDIMIPQTYGDLLTGKDTVLNQLIKTIKTDPIPKI